MLGGGFLADDFAGGEEVTGGFDECDQADEDECDDGGDGEFGGSKVERGGYADPSLVGYSGEVDFAEECGGDGSDCEADEYGGSGDGDGGEAFDK